MTFVAGSTGWRKWWLDPRGFCLLVFALVFALAGCGGGASPSLPAADAGPAGGGQSGAFGGQAGEGTASGGQAGLGGAGGGGGQSGQGGAAPVSADAVQVDTSVDVAAGSSGDGRDGALDNPAGVAGPACGNVCAAWAAPVAVGRVNAAGLAELSGMAASWRNPGVIYVHNDRDRPMIYALSDTATSLGTFSLAGAQVRDVEDMAVSRCPAGTCLYLADIGNNISAREEFAIYRATEPVLPANATGVQETLPAERFAFRYADGPHNAESLIVDPTGGGVFIVTKVAAGLPSAAYQLATFEAGRVNMATKIADLPVPKASDAPATSATAHPCGAGFLLRTGNALYDFPLAPGLPFAQAFRSTPVALPVANEVQSEAVTYRPDGRAIYTTSEGNLPPIHRSLCQ